MERKRFELEEIEDGSTFAGWISLDFDIKVRKKIKLANVKCHVITVPEGRRSQRFVEELIKGKELWCSILEDRYRRYSTILAVVYFKSETGEYINLNDYLIEHNMGKDLRSFPEETGAKVEQVANNG